MTDRPRVPLWLLPGSETGVTSRGRDGADLVRAELASRLSRRGAAKRVAHEIGVSTALLSRTVNGHIPPSERIATGLGFRKIVRFERAK